MLLLSPKHDQYIFIQKFGTCKDLGGHSFKIKLDVHLILYNLQISKHKIINITK